MNKKNISGYLEKIVHIVFSAVFSVCAFFSLFHFSQYPLLFQHNIIKIILFAGIAVLIAAAWEYIFKGKTTPEWNKIRIFSTGIFISESNDTNWMGCA